jgi:AAA domain
MRRDQMKLRTELNSALGSIAEEVCAYLLPGGSRVGNEWRVGSIAGEEGKSLAIQLEGAKVGIWKDFATDDAGGDLVWLWGKVRKLRFEAAAAEIKSWLAARGDDPQAAPQPQSHSQAGDGITNIDWPQCVDDLTADILYKFCRWRGYSPEFGPWLKGRKLVGLYDGGIAFPIHKSLKVVGVHYYLGKKGRGWKTVGRTAPLVLGDPSSAKRVHVFESQWDAFAIFDKLGLYKKNTEAAIVTRGAGNGAMVEGLIPPNRIVLAYKQNDEPKNGKRAGDDWLEKVCVHAGTKVRVVAIPAKFKDANDWTKGGKASATDLQAAIKAAVPVSNTSRVTPSSAPEAQVVSARARPIEFLSPLQLQRYQAPEGTFLVGDCHITRGSVFVIGGPPGVGKSRATIALAIAGALGKPWFGLPVHTKFRTMIIQNENGRFRLSRDFASLDCSELDEWVRISPPPPNGFRFDDGEFTMALKMEIEAFSPDIVIIDPWNAAAADDKAKDYLETFDAIRYVIPAGDDAPALGIVAHTRKPKNDDRASGRGLLNLLAGSYVLGSVPRTVFVMQAGSDDPEDDRVVWTCCKNNDGEMGQRSAWHRRDGIFVPVIDFDWDEFSAPRAASRGGLITPADVVAVFALGAPIKRADAVRLLETRTGAKRAACYSALKADGRFGRLIRDEGGFLTLEADASTEVTGRSNEPLRSADSEVCEMNFAQMKPTKSVSTVTN